MRHEQEGFLNKKTKVCVYVDEKVSKVRKIGIVREKRENFYSAVLEQMRKERFNGQVERLALDRSTHSATEGKESFQVQMLEDRCGGESAHFHFAHFFQSNPNKVISCE